MKHTLLILLTFLTYTLFAQRPGGGRGGMQQGQNPQQERTQKPKEFKTSDVLGIFYYDIVEVIKKTKVKEENKQYSVKKALQNYNFKIKEISFLNAKKFADLDLLVNSTFKGNDRESMMEMRKKVDKVVHPIREDIHEYEKELNSTFKTLLSEKQLKKWLKYQKKIKESLQPKKAEKSNQQGNRPDGNGRQMRR